MEYFLLVLLIFIVNVQSYSSSSSWRFPPCTVNRYSEGEVDFEAMVYNCSANIPSPLQPPSYFSNSTTSNTFSPTIVEVQIVLNSLIQVYDQSNQCKLDFLLRLIWVDERWYMPDLWNNLNPTARLEGLDIQDYVRNKNELNIWLPDITFMNVNEMNPVSEFIRFYENGTLFWSRHIIGTFTQPLMDFSHFPEDSQDFSLMIQSYSYVKQFLTLHFLPTGPVVLSKDTNGNTQVSSNQLWQYKGYSARIGEASYPSLLNPHDRFFSVAYYDFHFTRYGQGFVFRFALPIMLFLLLVGISYWAGLGERVNITLQVIVVVSALYLVVGQSIPVVGYLTSMDVYITTVFGLLTCTIGVHLITMLYHRKQWRYPLNLVLGEAFVLFFRITWIPTSFLFFMVMFEQYNGAMITLFTASVVAGCAYGLVHGPRILQTFYISIYNLRMKQVYLHEQDEKRAKGKASEENDQKDVENLMKEKFAEQNEKLILTFTEKAWLKYTKKLHFNKKE